MAIVKFVSIVHFKTCDVLRQNGLKKSLYGFIEWTKVVK